MTAEFDPAQIGLDNSAYYWTEIDEDLAGLPAQQADPIRELRTQFAQGDYPRAQRWHDPDNVDIIEDIDYVGDGIRGHKLDMYLPQGSQLDGTLTPVYVDIHGGGFVYGYKELNRNYNTHLAAQGVAVISLNYRPAPQTDFQGQLRDVADGLRWVREHVRQLPVDQSGIFLTGDSAGGTLALFASLIECNPDFAQQLGVEPSGIQIKGTALISALVHTAPFAVATQDYNHWDQDIRAVVGQEFFACLQQIGADQLTYDALARRNTPPMYVCTSSDDFLEHESLLWAAALAQAGASCEIHDWYAHPGEQLVHVFPVCLTWLDQSKTVLNQMVRFAREHL